MGPFVSCQAWLVVLVRGRRTHTAFSQAAGWRAAPSVKSTVGQRDARAA